MGPAHLDLGCARACSVLLKGKENPVTESLAPPRDTPADPAKKHRYVVDARGKIA